MVEEEEGGDDSVGGRVGGVSEAEWSDMIVMEG